MAEINKSGTPSLASLTPPNSDQLAGQVAGEDLGAYDAVYLKAADKKWYRASGAAASEAAGVRGYVPDVYKAGDRNVTVYFGDINVRYGAGLAAGKDIFLSGTVAGGFADTASTGGTKKLGFVIDDTRIRLYGTNG